jgi:hypothetical protein
MFDRSALLRLWTVLALALAPAGAALRAQTDSDAGEEPLKVHVFTFEHQSADDALGEIRPLFSDRGSVELKPSGDTVILRDRESELGRILSTLRDFDHPRRALRLEFRLLRAHKTPFSPQPPSPGVSPALVERLRQVLRYDTYESLAEVGFATGEGEQVAYDFGDDLGMEFRVGTVLHGSRLGLKDFRVLRRSEADGAGLAVLHANVVLRLGQTLAMVLMRDETAASALVIAINCDPLAAAPPGD